MIHIRVPAAIWAAWVVITLPIAALNIILYCLDIVEVY